MRSRRISWLCLVILLYELICNKGGYVVLVQCISRAIVLYLQRPKNMISLHVLVKASESLVGMKCTYPKSVSEQVQSAIR